jgi:hypothetical protein
MTEYEIVPEVVEQIRNSEKLRGPIEKVVLSADGKLVDGHQRKAADPDWPEEVNPKLKTEEDCVLFEIDKNWHRTNKSENWKLGRIEELARLGNSVQDVIRKTGLPATTVYRYYPKELKNKKLSDSISAAKQAASELARQSLPSGNLLTAKAEETARALPVECHNCHLGFRQDQVEYVEGIPYCKRCAGPMHTALENERKRLEREKESKKTPVGSLETAEEREAKMHPHDSKFQQDVFVELAEEGYVFEQNQILPVFTTEPDGLERGLGLLVYLDSTEVHKGKQLDKDDRLRDEYGKHHPEVTILPIPYTGKSEKEKARVKGVIRDKCDSLREELGKWRTSEKELKS